MNPANISQSKQDNSLGLLDDNYMQDLSVEHDMNSKAITDKPPPIPNKKKKSINCEIINPSIDMNNLEDTQNLEATVESIHFNDSDLKELEDEFTFDEEDDEECDGKNEEECTTPKNNARTETTLGKLIENTLVKRFDTMGNNTSNDLINESANILMLSNEFTKINKSDGSLIAINYDNMDIINDKSLDITAAASNTLNLDTFNETENSMLEKTKEFSALTINQTIDNNPSSIDRINQMVMQSVERVKRTAMSHQADNFLDNFNGYKLTNSKDSNPGLYDEKSVRRFSANSIKSQFSRMNNETINTITEMSSPQRFNNESQQLEETNSMSTLMKPPPYDREALNITEKTTRLDSIYFKPPEKANNLAPTSASQRNNNGANDSIFQSQAKESKNDSMLQPTKKINCNQSNSPFETEKYFPTTLRTNSTNDSMFQESKPTDDSMFQLSKPTEDSMFQESKPIEDSMFQKAPKNIPTSSDDSMFKQQGPVDDSMFKQQDPVDDSMFKQPRPVDDSMFKSSRHSIGNSSTAYLFKPQMEMLEQTSNQGLKDVKEQVNDSIFGQINPSNDSMFQTSNDVNNDMFKSQTQHSKEANNVVNDSIFGQINPSDQSLFQIKPSGQSADDSIFKSGQKLQLNESAFCFKSPGEFQNEIDDLEAQNRKEFASNNLTVLSGNDDSKQNTSNRHSSDKWWNLGKDYAQNPTVDLRISCSFEKTTYAVDDYFNQRSAMPDIDIDKNKIKPPDEVKGTPTPAATADETDFTLSSSLTTGRITSNNFSFTLNSSESGDFIQRKKGTETPQTPFQITKMLQKKAEAAAAAASANSNFVQSQTGSSKPNTSNLKTIGEELDRVSNRLANSNTEKKEFKVPDVPKVKTSEFEPRKNPEILPPMDETISSINTTSNNTAESKEATGKLPKPCISSMKPSSSGGHQNSKQKLTSGSLTSTPSKHKSNSSKSSSTHIENSSNYKNSESRSDITNTNSTISSTTNSTNLLFNQDSFISSIPERTNDSTLVGNHHHHHHHHKSESKTQKKNTTKISSLPSRLKNAEIQTSPAPKVQTKCESFANTSTIVTTTLSSTTTADVQEKVAVEMDDNKMTRSSLSSSDLANQLNSLNTLTAQMLLNNQNGQSSNRTSMLNNSNSSTTSNQLHPVMFLSLQQISNIVNELQTSQTKSNDSTNFSTNSVTHQSSNQMSNLSATSLSSNQSFNKFELPNIELNNERIDFGQIAEGCRDTSRVLLTITNPSILNQQNLGSSSLYIEFEDYANWSVQNFKNLNSSELSKKYEDLKPQLAKTLSLHLTRNPVNRSKAEGLNLDLTTNYYEFFVHLDTKDLSYFKDILYQQHLLKQRRSSFDTKNVLDESFIDPLLIKLNMSIYYCINHEQPTNKKYLVNRIGLQFVLGYARLKSSSSSDRIDFEIYEDDLDSSNELLSCKKSESINKSNEIDKTLTSFNDSTLSNSSSKLGKNMEQIIPLSNAGNIDIDVNCYFTNEDVELNDNSPENMLKFLKFKCLEVRLEEAIIHLQAKAKQKQYARLVLIKLVNELNAKQKCLDLSKTYKFIVQVKPDGFRYEIPVRIKLLQKPSLKLEIQLKPPAPPVTKSSSNIKIATSKLILFFGKTLSSKYQLSNNEPVGLSNEFTIKNLNEFSIKYQISINTFEPNDSMENCSASLFKFTPEMFEVDACCDGDNPGKMTQISLYLTPQQEINLKLKFDPSLVEGDSSLLYNGRVKITIAGKSERFNVYLVGFLNASSLEIDRVTKTKADLKSMDSLRLQKQLYRQGLNQQIYSLQMIKTVTNAKSILKKSLRLENCTINSKLIVYPICYYVNNSIEVMTQLQENPMNRNEKFCIIELEDCSLRMRLSFVENSFFHYEKLVWFEMGLNEVVSLNVECEVVNCSGVRASQNSIESFAKKFHQNFNIGLFWIESDLNLYCAQGIKQLEQNNQTPVSRTHDIALNGESFRLENLLNKIISNNMLSSSNQNLLNMSSSSSTSLNELSKSKTVDTSLNLNTSMKNAKAKIKRDDYYKLMCQSLKCSILNMSTMSTDHSIDDSFDVTNSSQVTLNESNLSKTESLTGESTGKSQDPWSISTDQIIIDNIKIDSNMQSLAHSLTLTNNVNRKLQFIFAYRQACLEVVPSNLVLKPFERCEVRVLPRNDIFTRLPWCGVVSVTCNRIKKDIKVSLSSIAPKSYKQLSTNIPLIRKSLTTKPESGYQPLYKKTLSQSSNLNSTASNPALIHSSSTPICSKSALSTASACTTLEQGSLISEISQNTLDSMSLTPLISASFISLSASKNDSSSLSKSKFLARKGTSLDSLDEPSTNDSSIIKILHFGNHAQVLFPPVYVTQRKSYDLTLINPTKTCVTWKAFSNNNPFIRGKTPDSDVSLTKPEFNNIFVLTPQVGIIQPNQKQVVKIEFNPVELFGVFAQNWEIDTNTEMTDSKKPLGNISLNKSVSYNCKLVLSGRSVQQDSQFALENLEDDQNSRLANRILKQKQNSMNIKRGDLDNTMNNKSLVSKVSDKSLKENSNFSLSYNNGSCSSFSGSLLSASTASSTSGSAKMVVIKGEQITFPDTEPGKTSKASMIIHNREDRTRDLMIMNLMDPFFCKYSKIKINEKHYMKVPVEFRPRIRGEYVDKILIRVDGYENPLTCKIKGTCV